MKKIQCTILCTIVFVILLFPMHANAEDRDMDRVIRSTYYASLQFSNGVPGEKVSQLSSGSVDKSLTSIEEYIQKGCTSVSVSASMDGNSNSDLYWSETTYKSASGNLERVAVLKADEKHPWTKDSCIIIKVEDVLSGVSGIEVEMGASLNGPRDYRIEYSLDGGNTWVAFNENGTDKGVVLSAKTIATVFKKNLHGINRSSTRNTGYNFDIYNDIYFKISVDSDYKVDGSEGLIGSNTGELAVAGVYLLSSDGITIEEPEGGVRAEDSVNKLKPAKVKIIDAKRVSKNSMKIKWKKVSNASGYEILYSKKSNFKKADTVNIKNGKMTSRKIKKLSADKKYYVKVRAYTTVNGKPYYGSWSKKRTVKNY